MLILVEVIWGMLLDKLFFVIISGCSIFKDWSFILFRDVCYNVRFCNIMLVNIVMFLLDLWFSLVVVKYEKSY